MVRLARELDARGLRSRMLLQGHDELLLEVPEPEVSEVGRETAQELAAKGLGA